MNPIPQTVHGLAALECLSAMQKCIRRGEERMAMEFACELGRQFYDPKQLGKWRMMIGSASAGVTGPLICAGVDGRMGPSTAVLTKTASGSGSG